MKGMKGVLKIGAALLLAGGLSVPLNAQRAAAIPAAQDGASLIPWLQPPAEFKEAQREGFHAGVEAAVKDYDHHRFPDVDRRKEYRHPKIDPAFREDYRQGFRRGYDDAIKHLMKTNGQHS